MSRPCATSVGCVIKMPVVEKTDAGRNQTESVCDRDILWKTLSLSRARSCFANRLPRSPQDYGHICIRQRQVRAPQGRTAATAQVFPRRNKAREAEEKMQRKRKD